ncbi:MAG: hypothetical protein ACRBN8_19555 [Nannocystales bacterium]
MNDSACARHLPVLLALCVGITACGDDSGSADTDPSTGATGATTSGATDTQETTTVATQPTQASDESGATVSTTGNTTVGDTDADDTGTDTAPDVPMEFVVQLQAQGGVRGEQRVNFAVPLVQGQLFDADQVTLHNGGEALAVGLRGLSAYPDGSLRSVQIQLDIDVGEGLSLDVSIGDPEGVSTVDLVPVADTLVVEDGTEGPRVWALLPADWLSASGVAGPLLPMSEFSEAAMAAWGGVCDYQSHNTESFLPQSDARGPWLYDRGTVMARGYAVTGSLEPLRSAYRESSLYRSTLTGSGADTSIGVPDASEDLKYHYVQNLAIHYLLTGDERFAEGAQNVASRAAALWTSPGYAGGADFWTERHAGFALLAYVWAATVTDDPEPFLVLADEAVTAYIDVQETYPEGFIEAEARCFAHHADAHGEGYGYFGCSPWMSAILADGLQAYVTERPGPDADLAREAIVKLGRSIAQSGLDTNGKPYYWMGVGTDSDEVDSYNEHWGEPAYVVAMAAHYAEDNAADLFATADALTQGMADNGTAPHIRSFNWQCRSAIATPFFMAR